MRPLLKILASLALVAIARLGAAYLYVHNLLPLPEARSFAEPPKIGWTPDGPRAFSRPHPAIPVPDTFHTMHGDYDCLPS